MFKTDDIVKMQRYCQSVINQPRPIYAQPNQTKKGKIFCEDWEIIEICKYIFNGEIMYMSDPPPKRLMNNDLWCKQVIVKETKKLMEEHQTADNLIEYFRKIREKNYA